MSAYNDAVSAYAHAKSMASANKAAKSNSSSYTTSSSAASIYSDTSSYFPVKDNKDYTPKSSSSKSSSLKNWTKNLVLDLGKSPTRRYDAAHASSTHSTNAVGAPYWDNNRHTKM